MNGTKQMKQMNGHIIENVVAMTMTTAEKNGKKSLNWTYGSIYIII